MDDLSRKIIDRIMKLEGKNQQEVGLQVFETIKQTFSRQIKSNNLDYVKLIKWAVSNKINFNWLMTGQGTPKEQETQPHQPMVVQEPHTPYIPTDGRHLAAEDIAAAIDVRIQSVQAYVANLHAAIDRLRLQNDRYWATLEKLLPKPDLADLKKNLVISNDNK